MASINNLFKDRDWPLVFCFANQKGGVGKTTLAVQFAQYANDVLGKKVLGIDLDYQGDFTHALSDHDEKGVAILGNALSSNLFDSSLGTVEPTKTSKGIDLIGTPRKNPKLLAVEGLAEEESYFCQEHLNDVLPKYDVVVIDCPPLPGRTMQAGLFMAHYVITPMGFGGFGMDSVSYMLNMTKQAQVVLEHITTEPQLYPQFLGSIINLATKYNEAQDFVNGIHKAHPELIFKNIVGNREGVKNASYEGEAVWKQRYQHVAGGEMLRVFREAFERVIQFERKLNRTDETDQD